MGDSEMLQKKLKARGIRRISVLIGIFCAGRLSIGVTSAASTEPFGIQPPEIAAWTPSDRQSAHAKADRLRAALREAVAAGEKTFIIPKDDYLLSEPFEFGNLDGMHIQGNGATFWTTGLGKLEFSNSVNCVVENLIMDRLQYPFIQGVVTEIIPGGASNGGDRIVLELEPGSMPADAKEKIGRTLCKSARTGSYYYRPQGYAVDRNAPREPGQWIWYTIPSRVDREAPAMGIGDRVAMHVALQGSAGIEVFRCGNMHFKDVAVYSAPGFQVFERGFRSPGGNTYTRLKIIPRPGSTRLATSTMDGFHSYNQKKGPTLIDCEIAGTYDDGINIHGFMNVILKKISDTEFLLCSQFGRDYEMGTELSFYQKPTMKPSGSAVVTGFEPVPFDVGDPLMEEAVRTFKSDYQLGLRRSGRWMEFYKVTVDRPVSAEVLDMAISPDYCGRGAHIKGLYMHDGCNRGVIIKAPEAVIEDSLFENTFFGAVYVTGELGPIEGDFADQVVIRNNRFVNCCYYSLRTPGDLYSSISPITVLASVAPKQQMAYLHVASERVFDGLEITGNTIENSAGIAMFIANTKGAVISNNHIINPLQEAWLYPQLDLSVGNRLERTFAPPLTADELRKASRPLYGIYVVASGNIELSGNVFEGMPMEAAGEIGIGPWSENVQISK